MGILGIIFHMNALEQLLSQSSEIEVKLGYTFKDKNLLSLAFIHRSFINENKDITVTLKLKGQYSM